MTEPRIVPPEEARALYNQVRHPARPVQETIRDLAHTAAVLGEQRKAALELHKPNPRSPYTGGSCLCCDDYWPCATFQALGAE